MQGKIASALHLKHGPVALAWTDEKPEKAIQFKAGQWGCVMWLFGAAAQGKTGLCDRKTFGCFGGGVGMGFGDQYKNFPGGTDCFCRFLSTGNEASAEGRQVAEKIKPFMREEAHEEFLHGERYLKSPEDVRRFTQLLNVLTSPPPTWC